MWDKNGNVNDGIRVDGTDETEREGTLLISFYEVVFHSSPSQERTQQKKNELQVNLLNEYRCKNPQ
jgi:hypothetical protein